MFALGGDVGSEIQYLRVVDTRGRELSRSAFPLRAVFEFVKVLSKNNNSEIK